MKKSMPYITTVAGAALLVFGLVGVKTFGDAQGFMAALPYVCIGLGCGALGGGIGEIANRRVLKGDPELARHMEIEKNDERNLSIANRAKGRAFDVMIPLFGALMLSFALMGIGMIPILMLVAAYLFVCGCGVYYRVRYEKEM